MVITLIAMVMLFGGISYAYFTANISGSESSSTIVTTGGTLTISYSEGNENISIGNVYPRETAWLTKTFTLTGTNTTALNMNYRVGINVISNGFSAGDLTYSLTNTKSDSGTPISNINNEAINTASGIQYIGYGQFVKGRNQEHKYTLDIFFKDNGGNQNASQGYTLDIFFKDNGGNQNASQGATFNGNLVVVEAGTTAPVTSCTLYDDGNGLTKVQPTGNVLYATYTCNNGMATMEECTYIDSSNKVYICYGGSDGFGPITSCTIGNFSLYDACDSSISIMESYSALALEETRSCSCN